MLRVSEINMLVTMEIVDAVTGVTIIPPTDFEYTIGPDIPEQNKKLIPSFLIDYGAQLYRTKLTHEMRQNKELRDLLRGRDWAMDPVVIKEYQKTSLLH